MKSDDFIKEYLRIIALGELFDNAYWNIDLERFYITCNDVFENKAIDAEEVSSEEDLDALNYLANIHFMDMPAVLYCVYKRKQFPLCHIMDMMTFDAKVLCDKIVNDLDFMIN